MFGEGGHATLAMEALLAQGERIVGLCCLVPPWTRRARARLGRLARWAGVDRRNNFVYGDPFDGVTPPMAMARGIPVLNATDLKTQVFRAQLRALAPDLLLVAGFHRLIPEDVVALAGRAAINLHPSLLPRHRGGTPNRWVVRLGENQSGATAHVVGPAFDSGDILARRTCAVAPRETGGEVERRVAGLMAELACEVANDVRAGGLKPQPQDAASATYEPPFHGRHQEIDWSLPAEEISRICRAVRPKSGGLARFAGKPVCVWDVEPDPGAEPGPVAPGTVVRLDEQGRPVVACNGGAAVITEVLWRGRPRSGSVLAQHTAMAPGAVFET